jgi:hypothetical protein
MPFGRTRGTRGNDPNCAHVIAAPEGHDDPHINHAYAS